jgi:hypothetical protein
MELSERNSTDAVIAAIRPIWEELLEQPVPNDDDDFFWLGGDSLLALMVADRIVELGYAMPRTGLFACPTLRGLAEALGDPAKFAAEAAG